MTAQIDFVDVVRREAVRCSRLLRSVDHAVDVPHLPGWTVGDVAAHLAGDFRWATGIITARGGSGGPASVHERGEALCEVFDDLAAAMVAAVAAAAADPDVPCPNFAERSRGRLGWWPRHQAHETTLHRWDLETAAPGRTPVDPALAADGVDELFGVYTRRYGPHDLDEPVTIRCLGVDAAWRVEPFGTRGRVRIPRVPGLPRADLEGDPAALLLTLWHRLSPDDAGLVIRSKDEQVRAFLAGPLTA